MDFTADFDAGPLYPLLENAWDWRSGDFAGAVVPDYAAILADPASYRGRLFLIEGQFNGVPPGRSSPRVTGLTRRGPWAEKLARWDIVVNADEKQAVLLYLVAAPATPDSGAEVRSIGRFYKVWRTTDTVGGESDFLLFIGRGAETAASMTADNTDSTYAVVMLAIVLLLIVAFYVLRNRISRDRTTAPVTAAAQRLLHDRQTRRADNRNHDAANLPEDPVAALDELSRRHESK